MITIGVVPRPTPIYRITHVANIPWILDNGLHALSTGHVDPNFVSIGNPDLIERRQYRLVEAGPGGTLDDYIPFYFCTHSVMLFNIHTRRVVGVSATQREVVHLVSSVERVGETGTPFVFTDRHAYVANASFSADLEDLKHLDWGLIRGRDFKRDPNRPDKLERRAAEFLLHQHIALAALLGIACHDDETCARIRMATAERRLDIPVEVRGGWYFR
jgi:hypothetical protein